ncbi:odorant receptor 47b [Drosophila grimshawi]|uniref:Odorant receptor n=1 Tax=Drosophila grimshawi TaxID=7222 RepID=B4J8W2_DROGR|nr:odorant receptor 47b [Drosophila grimshawi]EDW02402.1 GH19911 [Drosophila grimshawi]
MANGDFQSYLRLLRGFFAEFRSVLRHKKQQQRLGLFYNRAFMVVICLYPNRCLLANPMYKFCSLFVLANSSLFLLSVTCAIPKSTNVIDMGDDIVFMIGITLITTKLYYIHFRANEIDDVIEDFQYYEKIFKADHSLGKADNDENKEILRWQRICYLVELVMIIQFTVYLCFFNVAICMHPLISDRELPYHAVMPFGWQHPDQHPYMHALTYIWQTATGQFNLMAICHIDLFGSHTFMHTALNLKILCIEMKKLGKLQLSDTHFHEQLCKIIQFHQHIIHTIQNNSRVFHGTFITQMIASFALISISMFETMAAADNPKVAAKFVLLMFITFIQLSYWCVVGTLVYSQSVNVAQAAFELNDWHTKSIGIQRIILFMIMRSQKPLIYAAKPFPPFTMATYSIILQQCYRMLAVLREAM